MSAAIVVPWASYDPLPDSVTHDVLHDLAAIRDGWLAHGLRAEPADRASAEAAVGQLYRLVGLPRPRFIWVPSPPAGAEFIAAEGLGGPVSIRSDMVGRASARIACLNAQSRARMKVSIAQRYGTVRRDYQFHPALWNALRISLFDGVATAIKTLVTPVVGSVTWYGQQEAHRVAYFDALRRCGLATFRDDDGHLLDVNAALVRSTGWWWACDGVCVMSERPRVLHTEPTPEGRWNQQRLHGADGPAIEFLDGKKVFVDHGTIVPEWVIKDPTVERITTERNVEVRRSAIERLGWDTYIDEAGLELLDQADDPGNAGNALELYATPGGWGNRNRILLVTNGSRERDGHRRRYGLPVPVELASALDAAGWTYGISGTDYARLVRRT